MNDRASASDNPIQIENLQIVARPRLHWEALDLGVLIARRWYPMLLASWLCLAGPAFLLVWVVMPEHPIWAMLIVWWFKPVYERIPLRILSAAIFGATPTLKDAMWEWRAAIAPAIVQALTYRRLSLTRSFDAPVWMLEGLDGGGSQKRLAILQARAGSGAFWLTVIGVHVEAFLVLGLITGAYLFIPSGVEIDWWELLVSSSEGEQDWLVNVLYLMAMAAVAPIYVAAGFALYLNRRVELEAWDIEIGFRRLAHRVSAAVLVGVFVGLCIPGPELHAQPPSDEARWGGPNPVMEALAPRRQASRDAIYEVLAGPDFNQQRVVSYPKVLQDLFEPADEPPSSEDLSWLLETVRIVARVAEVLLWSGVVALVLWLLYRSHLLDRMRVGKGGRRRPHEILGLAVSRESLPKDIAGTAMRLWNEAEQREALSLIYRAALAALIERFHCELNAADTEGDCLVKARQLLTGTDIDYLGRLTRAWQLAAYAHVLPEEAEFADLCRCWPSVLVDLPDEP